MRALLILLILLPSLLPSEVWSQEGNRSPDSGHSKSDEVLSDRILSAAGISERDSKKREEPALLLKQRYNVKLNAIQADFRLNHRTWQVTAKPYKGKMDVGSRVLQALSLYPEDFIEKSGLREIIVCEDLKLNNDVMAGLGPAGQIFLNCALLEKPYSFSRTFHHELFHVFDPKNDGSLLSDSSWLNLNREGFEYRGLNSILSREGITRHRDDLPGFLSLYSTATAAEDKAELFSFLICAPGWVEGLLKRDACLALKAHQMKREIELRFPSMNAQFWQYMGHPTRVWEASPEFVLIRNSAFLGVPAFDPADDPPMGWCEIGRPQPNSPAELAGLVKGDVIVWIDKQRIRSFEDLQAIIAKCQPGQQIKLFAYRKDELITKEIKLGRWPSDF